MDRPLTPPRGVRIPGPVHAEEEMPHPIAARLALEVLWQQLYCTARPGELAPEEERVSQDLHATLIRHDLLARPWADEEPT